MTHGARTSVLFVCMGNICRSPLAEGLFRHKATERGAIDRFDIDSAGTGGWHAGAPPDPRIQMVAAELGVPIDGAARQVRTDDFSRFDHILCADEENLADLLAGAAPTPKTRLLLECDPNARRREVPDPYYGGAQGFVEVYELVDAACAALLDTLLEDARPSRG